MTLEGKIIANKYKIVAKIEEGGMSDVWIAEEKSKKTKVIVKILKKMATSNRVEDVIRFKDEAINASKLMIDGIAKVYEIGEFENLHYIVMEYIEGDNLQNLIDNDIKFSLKEVIELIYNICKILDKVHNVNIIHKDIKPGNIILNKSTKKNKVIYKTTLIDFGLSQVRNFVSDNSNNLIGTVLYMSPEQSGFIKRPIDERSDIYSLGILFYQLLLDRVPFEGENLNSIIYQHIAKSPKKPTLINPKIPVVIEKIILKLLEKEPEKRYQSIDGLIKDIEKYRSGNLIFEPGLDDHALRLNFRTNIIGREEELRFLKMKINLMIRGIGSVCFINGESGKGKTRIIEELRNYAYEKKILFIDGKCFLGETKTPYDPFKEALNNYLRYFEKLNKNERQNIIDELKSKLGGVGELLINFSPILTKLIKNYEKIEKLDVNSEKLRLNMALKNLFISLSKIHKKIIILLDDLQWVDESSMSLFYSFVSEIDRNNLMILGTYRNDEVLSYHRLKKFIDCSKENKFKIYDISLKAFNMEQMTNFIAGLLYDNTSNVEEISEYILSKSKGNPHFSIEILKQMINEKIVNRNKNKWIFNTDKLEKLDIPNSIVDIILKRVNELSYEEEYVASHGAIIGNRFDIEILLKLIDIDKKELVTIIDKIIGMQLLEYDTFYKGRIVFINDKIKEVFYKKIDEDKKQMLHLKVAKMIEKNLVDLVNIENIENDDNLFEVIYHYFKAGKKENAMKYLIPAAEKSKNIFANENAIYYYSKAICIMDKNLQKDIYIECILNISNLLIITGKSLEAIKLITEKFFIEESKEEYKIRAYINISRAYAYNADYINTEKYLKMGLKIMGEKVPIKKSEVIISTIRELLIHMIFSFFPRKIFWKDANKNKKYIKKYIDMVDFYEPISLIYSTYDNLKFLRTAFRIYNTCRFRLGKSKKTAMATVTYASIFLVAGIFKKANFYYEVAYNMFKELDEAHGMGITNVFYGHCANWMTDYNKSLELTKLSQDIFEKQGNIRALVITKDVITKSNYYLGRFSQMKEENDLYNEISIISGDKYSKSMSKIHYCQFYRGIGDFKNSEQYGRISIDEAYKLKDNFNYCCSNVEMGILYIEIRQIEKAIECLELAKEIFEKNKIYLQYTIQLYPYLAESYILDLIENISDFKENEKNKYLKKIKVLCDKSVKKTKQFKTHLGVTYRIFAKYYLLTKDLDKVEYYYKESIRENREIKREYELGKSLYDYGLFLKLELKKKEATKVFEEAYYIFKKIGSKFYEKKVREELGIFENEENSSDRFSKDMRLYQRMSSIISLSHDLSSILDLNTLLDKILSVAMEITGANGGYLLIKNEVNGNMEMFLNKTLDNEEKKLPDDIINEVIQKGEAVLTTNAVIEDKYLTCQSIESNELKSILCLPIKYNEEIKGICFLDNNLSGSVFSEDDIKILNSIMIQAAISIENAKLFKMAITDGLTGLITHKHFKYLLEKEVARCKRYIKTFSLLIFDLDNFKNINDNYGHQAGDKILSTVSNLAVDSFRSADIIARYGGEEFIVILTETDKKGAIICSDRFRNRVSSKKIIYEEKEISFSISGGISTYPEDGNSEEILIRCADIALYDSKNNGKNLITAYNEKIAIRSK
ncbi:MAG: diguanylate cyclase [Clostridiales bacterium]